MHVCTSLIRPWRFLSEFRLTPISVDIAWIIGAETLICILITVMGES